MDICLPHKSPCTIGLNLSQLAVSALKRPRSGAAQMLQFFSFLSLEHRDKTHLAELIIPDNLHNPKHLLDAESTFSVSFSLSL